MSCHGEKLRQAMHGMRFNAFHNQLAPSGRHAVAAGLVCAHCYCTHALHSGHDDSIDTCPCTLLHSASSRSGNLHICCTGLIKKSWNHSLECGAAAATGPSETGRLVPGLCCMVPESGMVNTVACESCGGSGVGSRGGCMGLAGRPRGARSVLLGEGTRMGLGACHMRGVKGSQTRGVAGRMSEGANGSGWLGRRAGDG